jgi:hypothetical protein
MKIYQGNGAVGETLISTPDCRLRVMVGRAGPETGKLITMIGLVAVANKKNKLGSEDDDTWWVTWSPEEGEDVKYTHARWSEMSYGELDTFQHGFSASLKERLDSSGAVPVSGCTQMWQWQRD